MAWTKEDMSLTKENEDNITIHIKTFVGNCFDIKCNGCAEDLIKKIEEYNSEYSHWFIRLYDVDSESEIKNTDKIENNQTIFLVISTDIDIKVSIYCHHDDEYGIDLTVMPTHLKHLNLKYLKSVGLKCYTDFIYVPSSGKFFDFFDDGDDEQEDCDDFQELVEAFLDRDIKYPKTQKQIVIDTVMKRWEEWNKNLLL